MGNKLNNKKGANMLHISDFNQHDITFQHAVNIMTTYGKNDLLDSMKAFKKKFYENLNNEDFEDGYYIEINAYNTVFEGMSKLFAPKELELDTFIKKLDKEVA